VRILLLAALLCAAGASAAPQSDRRIEKALERARLAFEVDDQGDFRVAFVLPRTRMGAWSRQGPMALFATRIAADADPKELADALEYTARAADAAEKEVNAGKDEY